MPLESPANTDAIGGQPRNQNPGHARVQERTLNLAQDVEVCPDDVEHRGDVVVSGRPDADDGTNEPMPDEPLRHPHDLGYLRLARGFIHAEHDLGVRWIIQDVLNDGLSRNYVEIR
jgi:hypothetical protein